VIACIKQAANVVSATGHVHNNFQANARAELLFSMLWRIARLLSGYRSLGLALATHEPKPAQ